MSIGSWFEGFLEEGPIAKLVQYIDDTLVMNGVNINIAYSVPTWAEVQAIPKTLANHGLTIICDEVGIGGSTWRYNHNNGRWYVYGRCILHSRTTAIVHTGGASLTTEERMGTFQLLNSGGQSILHDGDSFRINFVLVKTGTTAGDTLRNNIRVHTASADGAVGTALRTTTGSPTGANPTLKEVTEYQRINSTTIRNLNLNATVNSESLSTNSTIEADITVPNLDSTTSWINHTYFLGGTTDTNLTCKGYYVELITRGS